MTRSDLTHLYFLLDRSGSMQSIKSDIEGGFAAFVDEQRKGAGECRATLAQFDDVYEVVYADRPIADVPAARPAAAQHDRPARRDGPADHRRRRQARGAARGPAARHGHRRDHDRRPENASKEWTGPAIKALVEPADQAATAGSSSTWAPTRTPSRSGVARHRRPTSSSPTRAARPREAMARRRRARSPSCARPRIAAPAARDGGVHRRGARLAGRVGDASAVSAEPTESDERYFGGIRMPPSTRTTSPFM